MSWLILILRFLLGPIWAEVLSAPWESCLCRKALCHSPRGSRFGLSFREKLGDPPWPIWINVLFGRAALQPVPVHLSVGNSISVTSHRRPGYVGHVLRPIAFPPVAGSSLRTSSRRFCGT